MLAQIFINWRISPEVQFPNDWGLAHGPWAELSEGFLGPSYVSHIPDWFKADYYKNYLTIDQIKSSLKVTRLERLQRQLQGLPGLLRAEARPVADGG